MTDKILCVDDEASILAAYQRNFRKIVTLDVALGGAEGLAAIHNHGPYAVIISDMNMPGMDGIRFLTQAKEIAPNSVRMMLTGANDLATAIHAVNQGNIFRFLTKPCAPEVLAQAIEDGLRQYRLVTAERELLDKTLAGCTGVLTEILSLMDAESFGQAEALRNDIRALAHHLKISDPWELEIAAMLARIGSVTVPPIVTVKSKAGRALSAIEQDMVQRIPEVGSMLLANIPRLENVARIVLYVEKRFDGSGFPPDSVKGEQIPMGARVLRYLFDLAAVERSGVTREAALEVIRQQVGAHDPQVLAAGVACHLHPTSGTAVPVAEIKPVSLGRLRPGQILRCDIRTADDQLLIASGQTISAPMIERLANYARIMQIHEPILVEIPPDTLTSESTP